MKNAMRESLAKTLSHLKTARLKVIRSQMKDWDHVHAMKKNSWFWHENGNASSRRSSEQYYSRNESLQIGKVELHYFSDKAALLSALPQILKDEDTILVKASHFMEFRDIVTTLTNN